MVPSVCLGGRFPKKAFISAAAFAFATMGQVNALSEIVPQKVQASITYLREKIMLAKTSAELFLLLVLSTMPTLAPARASSNTTIPTSAQQFSASERAAILQEIKAFANAKISVRAAIRIAEKRATGAKAVDVSFDGEADRLAYRVKTYQHDEIWQDTVDASTGKLVGEEIVTPVSTLDTKDKIELAGLRTAGIDLSDVVPIAEKYGSGKAVSAGLEEENGRLIFLVVLVADGSLKQISVDPSQQHRRQRNASVGGKSRP